MNYLAYVPGEYYGGCEDYAFRTIEYIASKGSNVDCLFAGSDLARLAASRLPSNSFTTIPNPFPIEFDAFLQPRHFLRGKLLRKRYQSYLQSLSPSVVHAILPWHYHSIHFIQACFKLNIPLLVTYQLVAPRREPPRRQKRIMARALASPKVTISAISNNNRQLLAAYYNLDPESIAVIPNRPKPFVDQNHVKGIELLSLKRSFCEQLKLPSSASIILTVAALNYQKGIDILLHGVRKLKQLLPNAYFCIAGDGPEVSSLKDLAQSLGVTDSVRFLGHRSDVDSLLRISSLFLFPTRYEGESFALMEAARSRVPIVASAASGIPETFRDGIDAMLFPVGDHEFMVKQVERLLTSSALAEQVSDSAFRRISEFNESDMLQNTYALLSSMAS